MIKYIKELLSRRETDRLCTEKRRLNVKLKSMTKSRDYWRAKAKDAEIALRCKIEGL